MSIRANLLIALFLVVSVMLATAGYLGWSYAKITRQLDRMTASVIYLESIASVRSSITRQMKQVVDCLISDAASSGKEFGKASQTTEDQFSRLLSLRNQVDRDEFPRDNLNPDLVGQLNESYREWYSLATKVIELCDRNELEQARASRSETSFLVVESSLLNAIDNALEDERNRVQTEFNLLIMALGRLPWSNEKALRTLERVQATVDAAIALTRINTGISKQLKEVMDDLISPVNSLRPFGWAGNETKTALDDFRRAARKQLDLGLPGSSRLLSEATTLEGQYLNFTILCQQAMASRQAGDVIKAARLAESVIEQAMKEGLNPNLKQSIIDSDREIQQLSGTVSWQGIVLVTLGALLVIGALVTSLRGILNAFTLLERETSAISAGELDHRIDLPADTELGRLAASFNRMTDSLQKTHAELQDLNTVLEQRIEERTAQLASANDDLRLFSSSVCHDLKTPLSAISGYSQLLMMAPQEHLDQQTRETLQRIVDNSEEMAAIIGALMKLARVTEDEIGSEAVDLTMIARLVVAELKERQPGRTIEIEIGEGMSASGDGMLLRLVLENLIANAWKFSSRNEKGKIRIGSSRSTGETVYFVADNGAGFDMAMADSLFRPFGRLHDFAEFEGTGIGLATVKRIIDRHGGRIWAESEPGRGATFYFTLGG